MTQNYVQEQNWVWGKYLEKAKSMKEGKRYEKITKIKTKNTIKISLPIQYAIEDLKNQIKKKTISKWILSEIFSKYIISFAAKIWPLPISSFNWKTTWAKILSFIGHHSAFQWRYKRACSLKPPASEAIGDLKKITGQN